jgi:hypothetical protein
MALPFDKLGTTDAHAATVTDLGGACVFASVAASAAGLEAVARHGRAGVV